MKITKKRVRNCDFMAICPSCDFFLLVVPVDGGYIQLAPFQPSAPGNRNRMNKQRVYLLQTSQHHHPSSSSSMWLLHPRPIFAKTLICHPDLNENHSSNPWGCQTSSRLCRWRLSSLLSSRSSNIWCSFCHLSLIVDWEESRVNFLTNPPAWATYTWKHHPKVLPEQGEIFASSACCWLCERYHRSASLQPRSSLISIWYWFTVHFSNHRGSKSKWQNSDNFNLHLFKMHLLKFCQK